MTINLLAYSQLEGSAVVRVDNNLQLVRPPFKSKNITHIDEKGLSRLIVHLGFLSLNRDFGSWEELIEFLNERVRETYKLRGEDLSEMRVLQTIIDVASEEAIEQYLDRVQNEFIPLLKLERAKVALLTMLKSDVVRKSNHLTERIISVLSSVMDARDAPRVPHDDSIFESLKKKGMLDQAHVIRDRILQRHSIWAFAE